MKNLYRTDDIVRHNFCHFKTDYRRACLEPFAVNFCC